MFQDELKDKNFILSMSRKGTPIDNSPMESFFGYCRSEVLYNPNISIASKVDLIRETWECYHYYNNVRIQKRLGYLTLAVWNRGEMEITSKFYLLLLMLVIGPGEYFNMFSRDRLSYPIAIQVVACINDKR